MNLHNGNVIGNICIQTNKYSKFLKVQLLIFVIVLFPLLYPVDFYFTGLTADFLIILIITLYTLFSQFNKKIIYFNRIDVLLFIFILWYIFRTCMINNTFDSWILIKVFGLFLLYFNIKQLQSFHKIFLLLFISGLIQGILVIFQYWGFLPSQHYLFKATGSFFNPGITSIYLVISFLAGICGFRHYGRNPLRISYIIGTIFLFCCIILLNSRAAWMALLTGIIWFILSHKRVKALLSHLFFQRMTRLSIAITIGAIIGLGGAGSYALYSIRPESIHGRFLIWQVITKACGQSPWTGQGLLQALYMPLQANWFQIHPNSPFTKVAGNNIYAFNEFLRITFETGLIGLILFVTLLIVAGYYAFRGNKLSYNAGCLLFSIIGFGCFSYPFSVEVVVCVIIVLLAIISSNRIIKKIAIIKINIFIKIISVILCFLYLIFTIQEYSIRKEADRNLVKIQTDITLLRSETMNRFYNRLRSQPEFLLCYGRTLYNQELYKEAMPVLELAYKHQPTSELVCDLGVCYQYFQKYDKAEQAYLLAVNMTPAQILPHYRLFCLYLENNHKKKAIEKANDLLTMQVKVVNTSVLRFRNKARIFLNNNQ